jgi:hypothetical protein
VLFMNSLVWKFRSSANELNPVSRETSKQNEITPANRVKTLLPLAARKSSLSMLRVSKVANDYYFNRLPTLGETKNSYT